MVVERLIGARSFEKKAGSIQSEHAGISSFKQCLIIVTENLRFPIQRLMILG